MTFRGPILGNLPFFQELPHFLEFWSPEMLIWAQLGPRKTGILVARKVMPPYRLRVGDGFSENAHCYQVDSIQANRPGQIV